MSEKVCRELTTENTLLLVCLVVVAFAAGCSKGPSPTPTSSLSREHASSSDASQRIQHCTKLLMDSMQKPTAPFHFSYKGQENLNPKYPLDKKAKPEVGPVELEADISLEEIDLTSLRGEKKNELKAKRSDEGAWAFAQLDLVGPVTNTGILLAFGQAVARPAGSDTVGGVATEKYVFDTSTATGPTKSALEMAKTMMTNIKDTKGVVWLDKATGRLTKFNIDAEYSDKAGNSWKEHCEGEVTPK
jgi:hypothetical protein